MLLHIDDEMCLIYTSKSEYVVDRIKIASLNASLGGDGSRDVVQSTPFSCFLSLSV